MRLLEDSIGAIQSTRTGAAFSGARSAPPTGITSVTVRLACIVHVASSWP